MENCKKLDGYAVMRWEVETACLPTVMTSPKNMESNTTGKTVINGMNISGYAASRMATAHDSRLYLTAVASAPCVIICVYANLHVNFINNK